MNYGILLARGGDWQAAEEKHNQAVGIGQSLTASQRKADDLLDSCIGIHGPRIRKVSNSSRTIADDRRW